MSVEASGTTISIGTLASLEVKSVKWSGAARDDLDTTTLGTVNARTSKPTKLYDAGELSVETLVSGPELALIQGTNSSAEVDIAVVFPDSLGGIAGKGYVKGVDVDASEGSLITASISIKMSGAVS